MFHEEQYLVEVVITKRKMNVIYFFDYILLHNLQDQVILKFHNENENHVEVHNHVYVK
jgi:hypothetical protein